jgi:3-oxoacyl-[acyl-carrier-protein] synthase II
VQEIVITGIGVVLPGCDQPTTLWRQLVDGASQLRFHTAPGGGPRVPMGRIEGFDPVAALGEVPERFVARYSREVALYLASVYRARDDARLDIDELPARRVGLFDGVSRPALGFWLRRAAQQHGPNAIPYNRRDLLSGLAGQGVGIAASLLGVQGPTYTFSNTCSSGAVAIGHAMMHLQLGKADVAFASGHESCLDEPLFRCYDDANLLSRETADARKAVTPYVGYSTNAFGEGAVTLVLETRRHAEARGAPILARLTGYAYGNNGYHPMAVDGVGGRPAQLIEELLAEAGVSADDISVVVGHGNAVQVSDVSEENYMRRVFGRRSSDVPLVSVKPIYGHNLGCSSALNVAAATLMVQHDAIVPTINIDEDRLKRGTHHQPNQSGPGPCDHALAVSYGMGGNNTVVLVSKERGDATESG